jgi:chorismate-pyruvate lyase
MRQLPAGSAVRNLVRCSAALLLLDVLSAAVLCAADLPRSQPAWPDTFTARVEALAVLETLNAELLSHDSATATLEHWCAEHRLATPARVTALRVTGIDKPASAEQRRDLHVSDSEPLRYRRVRLTCGTVALSEADNWYVPGRLTAEMNQQLETSDTPFGKVVQPLRFQRHTLSADLLWHPLPEGWQMGAAAPRPGKGALAIPAQILRHRAVLTLPDGTPFSEVVETYTDGIFGFTLGGVQSSPN